jgi:hypothetical protein
MDVSYGLHRKLSRAKTDSVEIYVESRPFERR